MRICIVYISIHKIEIIIKKRMDRYELSLRPATYMCICSIITIFMLNIYIYIYILCAVESWVSYMNIAELCIYTYIFMIYFV